MHTCANAYLVSTCELIDTGSIVNTTWHTKIIGPEEARKEVSLVVMTMAARDTMLLCLLQLLYHVRHVSPAQPIQGFHCSAAAIMDGLLDLHIQV